MRFTMRSRLSRSLEAFASIGILLATYGGLPHSSFLNSLLKQLTPKDSFHEHARCMHHIRIKFSQFYQMFDFGDCDLCRGCHHGIEIARGLAINEVAPSVTLPGLDEGEIGFQRALHDVSTAVELARFF